MDDRFVNGFIAGIIAAFITGPIAIALKHFNLITLTFTDFAGILSLGRLPDTLAENLFAAMVDLMVSGALGIVFAFLILLINSKYLLFKGFFYAGAVWYLYYPTITIIFLERADIDVVTALINGILAGIFGLVMAKAYGWLYSRS